MLALGIFQDMGFLLYQAPCVSVLLSHLSFSIAIRNAAAAVANAVPHALDISVTVILVSFTKHKTQNDKTPYSRAASPTTFHFIRKSFIFQRDSSFIYFFSSSSLELSSLASITSERKLLLVYTHMSAAISIDLRATSSADNSGIPTSARAAAKTLRAERSD